MCFGTQHSVSPILPEQCLTGVGYIERIEKIVRPIWMCYTFHGQKMQELKINTSWPTHWHFCGLSGRWEENMQEFLSNSTKSHTTVSTCIVSHILTVSHFNVACWLSAQSAKTATFVTLQHVIFTPCLDAKNNTNYKHMISWLNKLWTTCLDVFPSYKLFQNSGVGRKVAH